MERKTNAVLRTEKRLRVSLSELLRDKNYKNVSVKELTDNAEMSRAAFYLHFDSMDTFLRYCKKHLMKVLSEQLIAFLDNRERLEEVCKRSNLVVSTSDRDLFMQYRSQEIYFIKDRDFNTVNAYFYEYFRKRFSDEFVEKNETKLEFFIRAYTVTAMELFDDYSRDRAKKEMQYTFMVWDKLFPENEL